MVDAAQAMLFVPTIEQWGLAVGAEGTQHADLAGGVPESHQILTEQAQLDRVAIRRREFRCLEGGDPEPAQVRAHGRAGTNATQELVIFCTQHALPPS
jgi:hypothetical protein